MTILHVIIKQFLSAVHPCCSPVIFTSHRVLQPTEVMANRLQHLDLNLAKCYENDLENDIICVAQITFKFVNHALIVDNRRLLLLWSENLANLLGLKEYKVFACCEYFVIRILPLCYPCLLGILLHLYSFSFHSVTLT